MRNELIGNRFRKCRSEIEKIKILKNDGGLYHIRKQNSRAKQGRK